MTGEANFVQYHLTGEGYRVTVYDANAQPVEEYQAGDHPLDSQAVAPKGHKVPAARLRKWAKQTAGEFADKYGVSHDRISYDADGEADSRAMLRELQR